MLVGSDEDEQRVWRILDCGGVSATEGEAVMATTACIACAMASDMRLPGEEGIAVHSSANFIHAGLVASLH